MGLRLVPTHHVEHRETVSAQPPSHYVCILLKPFGSKENDVVVPGIHRNIYDAERVVKDKLATLPGWSGMVAKVESSFTTSIKVEKGATQH